MNLKKSGFYEAEFSGRRVGAPLWLWCVLVTLLLAHGAFAGTVHVTNLSGGGGVVTIRNPDDSYHVLSVELSSSTTQQDYTFVGVVGVLDIYTFAYGNTRFGGYDPGTGPIGGTPLGYDLTGDAEVFATVHDSGEVTLDSGPPPTITESDPILWLVLAAGFMMGWCMLSPLET